MASLTGSGTITYHDYQSLPLSALQYNPPACGMPYAQLDLTRITAVQQLDKATDCGQCLKVCNADDPSKFVYVLAVDLGGRGLDLTKPAFGKLFNIDDGVGPAQWSAVDSSYCAGIWNNGSGLDSSLAPASESQSSSQPVESSSQPVESHTSSAPESSYLSMIPHAPLSSELPTSDLPEVQQPQVPASPIETEEPASTPEPTSSFEPPASSASSSDSIEVYSSSEVSSVSVARCRMRRAL